MEFPASDLGSIEIVIDSQASPVHRSIYVAYQSRARPSSDASPPQGMISRVIPALHTRELNRGPKPPAASGSLATSGQSLKSTAVPQRCSSLPLMKTFSRWVAGDEDAGTETYDPAGRLAGHVRGGNSSCPAAPAVRQGFNWRNSTVVPGIFQSPTRPRA